MNEDKEPSLAGTVGRRTIVKGAAWSIPVVAFAVAAPSASASAEPCGADNPGYIEWGDFDRGQSTTSGSGVAVVSGGASLIPFTVGTSYGSSPTNVVASNDNLRTQSGGMSFSLITQNAAPDKAYRTAWAAVITITFTTPVENVTFSIGDIEQSTSQTSFYQEWVRVAADGTNYAASATGANIVTTSAPTYTSTPSGNVDASNPAHTVNYSIAGPVTSIQITQSRPSYQGSVGGLEISNINFTVPC